MSWYIEIVEWKGDADPSTDTVVKRLGPYANQALASKADDGVTRNLNHERYYSRLVEEKETAP